MVNWIIGIPLLTLFASVALAIRVIPSTRREPGRATLNLLLLLIVIWTFSSVMFHSTTSPSSVFWIYLILACGLFTGAVGVHFSAQFTKQTRATIKWLVAICYILNSLMLVPLLLGKIVEEAALLPNGIVEVKFGSMASFIWGIIGLGISVALIILISTLIKSSYPEKKYTIFPVIGFIVMASGAMSNMVISSYPVDIAANFIFISFITYGVVGTHMIRPAHMQPLRLIIPVIALMLALCYAAVVVFCLKWLEIATDTSHLVATIIVLLFGSIVFGPSRIFLANNLARFLFPQTYRYRQAFSDIARVDKSLTRWANSVTNILSIIAKATSADDTTLLVRNSKTKYFEVKHAVGHDPASMLQLRLPISSPLVKTLVGRGTVLSTGEIGGQTALNVLLRGKYGTLQEIGPTLYCGVQGHSGLLAIVALTRRSPHVWDRTEDKDFLELACSQIAPLIINADLYQHGQLEIEERKRMAEALAKSEEKYRTLVENTTDCIYMIDKDKKLLSVNKSTANFFGKEPEELVGKTIQDIFPHKIATDYITNLNQMFITGMPRISESKFVVKDKELWLQNFLNPIKNQEGEVISVIGVSRDITGMRKLQEEQQEIAKLESVGTLAGGIAHDFNNILTGIMGNIGLAMRHVEPKSKAEERLLEAEKASLRAKDLTQQLLTFARGGAPIKKIVSIAELIQDSAIFALRGAKTIPEFSLPDDLWPAEIDEGQVSQAITNLVINADQAMPEGGILNIGAKNTVIRATSILLLPKGNYVEITIEDHGVGISKKHLDKIFDPYFTTKQRGSGLGLTTTYSIIKNHGGHITVESTQNVGTTFHIYLPTSKKPMLAKEEAIVGSPITGKGRILVMDDEEVIRQLLDSVLTDVGYEVELTNDGAEAIERYKKVKESGEPFDAVIMDLTIPGGMSGREAIKQLLEIDPGAKVIVSSGYSTDPVMADYKKYGFSAVITKPYTVAQIEKVLQSLLAKKK